MSLASPAYKGSSHFFLFVVVINFIATVLWSFVHFLGIKDALRIPINWVLSVSDFIKPSGQHCKVFFIGMCEQHNFYHALCCCFHYSNGHMDRKQRTKCWSKYYRWIFRSLQHSRLCCILVLFVPPA